MGTTLGLISVAVFGALAIAGVETGRRVLTVVGKPLATLALLPVLGVPVGPLGRLVQVAILLSLVGDVALLGDGDRAFLVGLGSFLVAHLCFVGAFASVGHVGGTPLLVGLPVVALIGALYVRRLWPTLGPLGIPVALYTAAVCAMVASALATVDGGIPLKASAALSVGASLFLFSDANLGWLRFQRIYRHGHAVTLAAYWLGQVGIALGARWSTP